MNARIAVTLVVLLAVLGGGALLYQHQERARRPDNVAALGKPLVKDLKAADIASIKIAEPKAALTLQRKDDGWVIAERRGFPADVSKVRDFVVKTVSLKVGQSEPVGEKDRARLNLDTQVEFNGADGKPLSRLIVGKKYFKREVDNPEKAPGDGRFVALPGEAGTVYIISDPLTQATARSAEWIDRASFQVEKVKTLEVRRPGGESWRLERQADNADWKLAGMKPGEKLDVGRANAATYSLSLLELADVAPDDAKDTGLDNPTLVNASTLDGLTYEIKVGRLEGDNYFVRFSSSGSVNGPESDERIKKLKERLPREKVLSDHVLLISKSKLEDTLKPRAELLEKKPDGKK
ncbi:MAG TPA: DUF4340 domain-containing protein [Burkholderiales bacterium]|nr:DUF4340 domain-containing protein [Burkholderiales bacterium]